MLDDVIDDLPAQVRLNLISMQLDEKLKSLMVNLNQSLAAKVCYIPHMRMIYADPAFLLVVNYYENAGYYYCCLILLHVTSGHVPNVNFLKLLEQGCFTGQMPFLCPAAAAAS